MGRPLWIIIGLIGAALIWLIARGEGATTFGLDNDRFANLLYMGIWGAVLAPAILFSGRGLGDVARNLAIWLLIMLVLVAGYQYRYELQDVASRVTAGIIPGSPVSMTATDGASSVMISKSSTGHFEAAAMVNGVSVRFLVDTGATSTVLSKADARAVGIDTAALVFATPIQTANGQARAARAKVDTLVIGAIARGPLPVLVADDGQLSQSLLGMNYLRTLNGLDIRRDRMILRD